MKIKFLVVVLFFFSCIKGQAQESDYLLNELLKFESSKEKLYSKMNREKASLSIMYQNGIYAYIHVDKQENEESVIHRLSITYFIPEINQFIKNKRNQTEILNLVKQEINKNNFLLQTFFNEAYENAIKGITPFTKEDKNDFFVYAVNPDFSSELVIKVFEVQKNQYTINIYYNIEL